MAEAVVLRGALQGYPWGRINGLSAWTGRPSGGPEAELWFGNHPAAPSPVVGAVPDRGRALATAAPLLVKILAARQALSLQIHPAAAAIRTILDRGDGHLLADSAEKSELLIAVERFGALVGLRPLDRSADIARALGLSITAERLAAGDIRGAIRAALGGEARYDDGLATLPPDEAAIMRKVLAAHGGDRGLPVAFLMQPRILEPGDAAAVPVGVPHAYVEGLGVEVMTSSDNVLRLGMTGKAVSVESSLIALDPKARPEVLRGDAVDGRYDSAVLPFSVCRMAGDAVSVPAGGIALCLDGELTATSPRGRLAARRGEAIYVESGEPWTASCAGSAYLALPKPA